MYKYEVIADILREKIKKNELKVNEQLPSEKELVKEFNCSRMTIKKAMDILSIEGYITRSRGLGTYVRPKFESSERKRYSNIPNTFGFSNSFKDYDNKKNEVIEFKVIECDKIVANYLQIKEKSFVYFIKRLHIIDDIPIILEEIYIDIEKVPRLTKEILEKSLYSYIENDLKITIYNADKIIRAKKAEKDDEKYLKIKKDIPILEMEHIVYSKNNVPIEYAIVHYKSDIYELHFITPR